MWRETEDEGPDAASGKGSDCACPVLEGGVRIVRRPRGHPPRPPEVIEAWHAAEQERPEQHDAAGILMAPQPIDGTDKPEEEADEEKDKGLDPHRSGSHVSGVSGPSSRTSSSSTVPVPADATKPTGLGFACSSIRSSGGCSPRPGAGT